MYADFTHYDVKTKIGLLLFTALLGGLFIDSMGFVLSKAYNLGNPLDGYASLGKWFLLLIQGKTHWVNTQFSLEPSTPVDYIVGLGIHLGICLLDAFLFLYISFVVLKANPRLNLALLLMWGLLIMPFFIQMPAMGLGYAGSLAENGHILRWRSFICHSTFGVGIWLAPLLFHQLKNK